LSPIHRDARVLRQIDVLRQHGDVTTLGYGSAPAAAVEHLEVDASLASLPQTPAGVALLATRRLRRAQAAAPALKEARRLTKGKSFDLIVANEARILPVAMELATKSSPATPVWADMHEWAPQERSHVTSWRLLVAPLMEYVCREYLPRAAAVTTVGETIAQMYRRAFGIDCEVVRNARPFVDLEPSVPDPGVIRLAHSGGAVPGRNIEVLIAATLAVPHTTLDLILVPGNDGGKYLRQLHALAAQNDRVRFHDAVAPDALPLALNRYDVGIYCLPPANLNMEFALPNKLFDFVQGRLGMVVGPSPEMAAFVREHGLGTVANSFEGSDFTAAIAALTPESVARGKQSAHAQARALSSDADVAVMNAIVGRLLAS
jgi:hypothetical protein